MLFRSVQLSMPKSDMAAFIEKVRSICELGTVDQAVEAVKIFVASKK